jgi:hypothetical protein
MIHAISEGPGTATAQPNKVELGGGTWNQSSAVCSCQGVEGASTISTSCTKRRTHDATEDRDFSENINLGAQIETPFIFAPDPLPSESAVL